MCSTGWRKAGIGRAVVNVHHFADQIEAHLKMRFDPQSQSPTSAALFLKQAAACSRRSRFSATAPSWSTIPTSVWTEGARSNLRLLMEAWAPRRMDGLLLLARRDLSIGYAGRGDYRMDASGCLTRRGGGEETPYVFAGVSILKPRLFEGVTELAFSLVRTFDRASARGALYGVVLEGTWMHVGTPEALIEAESHLNEGQRRQA